LHDAAQGIVENTISAARAAIEAGFAIECDVRISADGEALVFHDATLERLTHGAGHLDQMIAQEATAIGYRDSQDRIPTLTDFCAAIDRRTPLFCEIKSRFDGDMRLAERVAAVAKQYAGPFAIKSFDPEVIAHLNKNRRRLGIGYTPLGVVAQATYDRPQDEWNGLDPHARFILAHFLHYRETVPDFLSYRVDDLPGAVPFLCRNGVGIPVLAWTVRTPEQRAKATQWADQVIFEGAGLN
jgi:glycerophosphoryl diester phosphodiesterase